MADVLHFKIASLHGAKWGVKFQKETIHSENKHIQVKHLYCNAVALKEFIQKCRKGGYTLTFEENDGVYYVSKVPLVVLLTLLQGGGPDAIAAL